MDIFARLEPETARQIALGPVLLLEGSWPADRGRAAAPRWALDDLLDARHAALDADAVALAESIASASAPLLSAVATASTARAGLSLGDLLALRLRYWSLKLLRAAWFFEAGPGRGAARATAWLAQGRDDDYAALLTALAAAHGFELEIRWRDGRPAPMPVWPSSGLWRRTMGRLVAGGADATVPRRATQRDRRPAVALVGNLRNLDAVCATLPRAGFRPIWLYHRFCVAAWRRWAWRGVPQLVCDGLPNIATAAPANCAALSRRIVWRGVDLTPAVTGWLDRHYAAFGEPLAQMALCVERQLDALDPAAVIVDEDLTPMPRLAVDWARRHDRPSLLVQHGAPCVRFGFAAPRVDRFCAWGSASRRQLERWGVPSEQIAITGWPALGEGDTKRTRTRRRRDLLRVLLLCTVPPRDDRPDAVEFPLTTDRYRQLLLAACEGLSLVMRRGDTALPLAIQLTVRPHPRAGDDPILCDVLRQFPQLSPRFTTTGSLHDQLARADVALGCASSSVVEALHLGVPAVQLLPAGAAGDLFDPQNWGLAGTCRTADEVAATVGELVDATNDPLPVNSFHHALAATGMTAAANAVAELRDLLRRHSSPAEPVALQDVVGGPQSRGLEPFSVNPDCLQPERVGRKQVPDPLAFWQDVAAATTSSGIRP